MNSFLVLNMLKRGHLENKDTEYEHGLNLDFGTISAYL